jgi:hypothetical protein
MLLVKRCPIDMSTVPSICSAPLLSLTRSISLSTLAARRGRRRGVVAVAGAAVVVGGTCEGKELGSQFVIGFYRGRNGGRNSATPAVQRQWRLLLLRRLSSKLTIGVGVVVAAVGVAVVVGVLVAGGRALVAAVVAVALLFVGVRIYGYLG